MKAAMSVLILSTAALCYDLSYRHYDDFLTRHVCTHGVRYAQISQDTAAEQIAREFAELRHPEFDTLAEADQIAYLVNLYNFQTIMLIVRNYPLKTGIRDIDSPWDKPFISLFGAKVTLNYIEHDFLRRNYREPRIHFALNCASKGCPALLREPYTGEKLENQLDSAAAGFLADTTKNRLEGNRLRLSEIFDWYGNDFKTKYGGYLPFVCSVLGITGQPKVKFLEYDWSLNDVAACNSRPH